MMIEDGFEFPEDVIITSKRSKFISSIKTEIKDELKTEFPEDYNIGKKHALKKYEQFVRNASCFCTVCTFFAISIMAKNQFLHQKKV